MFVFLGTWIRGGWGLVYINTSSWPIKSRNIQIMFIMDSPVHREESGSDVPAPGHEQGTPGSSGAILFRKWCPIIRVRRKLPLKDNDDDNLSWFLGLTRTRVQMAPDSAGVDLNKDKLTKSNANTVSIFLVQQQFVLTSLSYPEVVPLFLMLRLVSMLIGLQLGLLEVRTECCWQVVLIVAAAVDCTL